MNKILVVEDINRLDSGDYLVDYHDNVRIDITGKVNLSNYDVDNNSLEISVDSEATLDFKKVNRVSQNVNIDINLEDNCTLEFDWLIVNRGINKVVLNVNMNGNNSNARIKVRAINLDNDSNLDLICNGNVYSNTCDNIMLEDLKGLIIYNDSIKISPNMNVSTNEVMANHMVTIGSFDKDVLFYLTSRGFSIEEAKKLMINAFTSSILNEELKKIVKTEVIKIE